jgi:hypothetical protein
MALAKAKDLRGRVSAAVRQEGTESHGPRVPLRLQRLDHRRAAVSVQPAQTEDLPLATAAG